MNRKQRIFKVATIAFAVVCAARLTEMASDSVNPHIKQLEQQAESQHLLESNEDDEDAPL